MTVMNITLKLFASLTDYLPEQARGDNRVDCAVATGATVGQIIHGWSLPPKLVHLVLVNGSYVAPEQRDTRVLADSDVLAIWPPIAGG